MEIEIFMCQKIGGEDLKIVSRKRQYKKGTNMKC